MNAASRSPLLIKEDYWAIWLGLGLILTAFVFYAFGASLTSFFAVSPPKGYSDWSELEGHFADKWYWYLALYGILLTVFSLSVRVMGHDVKNFIIGFTILFTVSLAILTLTSHSWAQEHELNYALVALALGLIIGNAIKLPKWFDDSLRTEYFVKTGIVMLGATLSLTLIYRAGPYAFLQATIVSVVTWSTIFFIGTKLMGIDRRFAAVMGAGGAICGVSASIAVGGAVKAEKEHIAITISIVTIAALVMIFLLPFLANLLGLHPAVAGAWIGNSEFADAAGFAAAAAIDESAAVATGIDSAGAVKAFTLVKVIGRDIWIGIWAFLLALISVIYWERGENSARPSAGVIWERFPKFVLGFFVASAFISILSAVNSQDHYDEAIYPLLIKPIKTLRTWTFCLTFLCIGLTTRFRELTRFGAKPLWAFTIGVLVNVPLGYVLSEYVFGTYWRTQIH
jgi:uncharacterized integral membrane protein (TIGR00698 family)